MNLKTPDINTPSHLIIFDGVCNFCNASINFIIQRDPNAVFTFTHVQSDIGTRLLRKLGIDPNDPNTFVLIKHGEVYLKSNAALEISKNLNAGWPMIAYFRLIPTIIRDSIYGLFARNRYRIMGKRDHCMVPSADFKARFID